MFLNKSVYLSAQSFPVLKIRPVLLFFHNGTEWISVRGNHNQIVLKKIKYTFESNLGEQDSER